MSGQNLSQFPDWNPLLFFIKFKKIAPHMFSVKPYNYLKQSEGFIRFKFAPNQKTKTKKYTIFGRQYQYHNFIFHLTSK